MKTRILKTEEIITRAISQLHRTIALSALSRKVGGNGYIIDRNIQLIIASYIEIDSVNVALRDELSRSSQYAYNCLAYALTNLVRPQFQLLFLSLFPRAMLLEWCKFNHGILTVLAAIAPKNRIVFLTDIYGSEAFNKSYCITPQSDLRNMDAFTHHTIIKMIGDEKLKNTGSNEMEHFLYFLDENVQRQLLVILGKDFFIKNIEFFRSFNIRTNSDPVRKDIMQTMANEEAARRFLMVLNRINVNNIYFLLEMMGWDYLTEWLKQVGNSSHVQAILGKLRKNDEVEQDQKCFIEKLAEANVLFACLGGCHGLGLSCKVLPHHLRLFLFEQLGSEQLQASLGSQSHNWSTPLQGCRNAGLTHEEEMHFFRVLGQSFAINNFRKIVEAFGRFINSEIMNIILDWVGNERLVAGIEEVAKISGYNRCFILQQLPVGSQMHYVRLLGKVAVDKYIKFEVRHYLNEKNREDFDKWLHAEATAALPPLPSFASPFVKFQQSDLRADLVNQVTSPTHFPKPN
jgi:hypothetical protein